MHPIPVSERISIVYADKGVLEQDGHQLVLAEKDFLTVIPVGKTVVVLIASLSKRSTEQIWEQVVAEKLDAAFLAFPARNELGWNIITSGNHQYCVDDNYGLPLVKFIKKAGVKAKSS